MLESSTFPLTEADGKPTSLTPPAPGAGQGPLPPDEFAHIPARRGRPPLLALSAVLLALFLGYHLRHDLSYAFSSSAALDVGDAGALVARPSSEIPVNRTVRLTGTPERESAVILDTQGSWQFTQLFRLRGTGGRVFVRRVADPVPVPLAERDQYVGRLVPFDRLSFGPSIARYFAARVSATHFFEATTLVSALGKGPAPLALKDVAGEAVTLQPQDRLFIDVLRPGELELELPRERQPDKNAAARAIAAAGGKVTADRHTADRWIFTVAVAADRQAQITSALGDIDRAARLRPARDTLETPVSAIAATAGATPPGLTVTQQSGALVIPFDRLGQIRTRSPVQVPADALLLVEGERPRDSWKSVVVLGFLLAFVVVNLLALRRPA